MGMNRTPIDSSMTVNKAISQGGYYNTDSIWNSVITLDEYPGKVLRGRVETLILKDGKLFMLINDNGYRIPGGGFDKGVLNKDQAFIESKEEAKLIIDNIRFSGVTYVHIYEDVIRNEGEIAYDGTYNEVYVANYKDKYQGYIRKGLSDMQLTNNGQFYEISEIENILKEPHKQALSNMLNNVTLESANESKFIEAAQYFINTLQDLHDKDMYDYIDIYDIDSEENDDTSIIFGSYNTSCRSEENEIKDLINNFNELLADLFDGGYVEESTSYKGYGLLTLKRRVV